MGRVAWIVCGSLLITHALTVLIILRERGDQGMRMMLAYVGRDVATSVAILDRIPPAERPAWLPRLARQNYGYLMGEASGLPPPPCAGCTFGSGGGLRTGAATRRPCRSRHPYC